MTQLLKLLIELGSPYAAVIGVLPCVASVDHPLLGVPFVYAWIFGCLLLMSGCLFACWMLCDRHLAAAD